MGKVTGYSDANWAGEIKQLIPAFRCCSVWASRKQTSVALSTVEVDYMALSMAAQEVVWICQQMTELTRKEQPPTVLWEDNQCAICAAKNPVFSKRTTHIQIRYYFVREHIIDVTYCPRGQMVADNLTKALPRVKFQELRTKMGLISID